MHCAYTKKKYDTCNYTYIIIIQKYINNEWIKPIFFFISPGLFSGVNIHQIALSRAKKYNGPPSSGANPCRHMKCMYFLFLICFIRTVCVNETYSNVSQLSDKMMFKGWLRKCIGFYNEWRFIEVAIHHYFSEIFILFIRHKQLISIS